MIGNLKVGNEGRKDVGENFTGTNKRVGQEVSVSGIIRDRKC